MPSLTTTIGPDGPVVDLGAILSYPRHASHEGGGLTNPPPCVIRGLIDTGASCTCIDKTVVAKLCLTPTGTTPIHTPSTGGTPLMANQYDIVLFLFMDMAKAHLISINIAVIEADFSMQNIDALLGRDVLAKLSLFYNGPAGTMILSS